MIPFGAIRYVIYSTIIVVCLFAGIRCIFAHDLRRESWRSSIKHRIYFSRSRFKVLTLIMGWVLLFIALFVAYFRIIELLER